MVFFFYGSTSRHNAYTLTKTGTVSLIRQNPLLIIVPLWKRIGKGTPMANFFNSTTGKTKNASAFFAILKSALAALVISILLVVLAAFLLQKQVLSIESITILNPVIKAASALIAALIGVRKFERRSFLYGGLSGLIYIVITFLAFSLFANEFSFTTGNLIDFGICTIAGMAGGIIASLAKTR